MQVIGICRFSYPALGGFQVEHPTIEARQEYLYAPKRMEERLATFETFTLPGIRAQYDQDFTFLIVIGDGLPAPYLARLKALVADIPQVVIQSHPPLPHRQVMNDAINSVRRRDGEPSLQFRLDDDDAVGIGFVARLREAAGNLAGLMTDHRHVAIDFNQGYIARPGPKGIAALPIQQAYWTAGLAVMLRPDIPQTIMSFGHNNIWKRMPTVTFTGEDMMIRGHNDYNDSRQKANVKPVRLKPLDADGELLFQAIYNINADHVRRVFSTP